MSKHQQRANDQSDSASQAHSAITTLNEEIQEHSIFADGLIAVDKNGQIRFINKIACKLTGWSQAQSKNQPFQNIIQLNNHSTTVLNQTIINHVIESGQLVSPLIEQEIITKKNETCSIYFSISPLDENTAIIMFQPAQSKLYIESHSLLYQANYDPLTRLLNRKTFQGRVKYIEKNALETSQPYSCLLLNIDHFKLINERYGQASGDDLLRQFAECLQFFIRDNDIAARWAGEEFICVLPNTNIETATRIAERLRQNICAQTFLSAEHNIVISASIGISNYPQDGKSPEELFCVADATLYEAKARGRNRVQNNQQLKSSIFSIGSALEKALHSHRLISVQQPIFDIQSGKHVAEESLARIQEKDGTLIEAGDFIDAAVKLQLVHRIDQQILKSTITRCCINYSKNNIITPHFVNISADFLRRPSLVKDIVLFMKKEFTTYGLDKLEKKPFVIEITEQEILQNIINVQQILEPFIELGLELAIDDFGSGYSSLTYLADLPISYLKFDGALIKRIKNEERAKKIITGIQVLAESLELTTIAEHIEDQQTLNILREIGVTWGQGFIVARPS